MKSDTEITVKPAECLQERIGYRFRNESLLTEALTHSSYCNENKHKTLSHNERLEFLGDSILSVITAEFLFTEFGQENEGFLTRTRAALVCEATLAKFASEIELGDYMYFGHGEIVSGGGKKRRSIVADAFEALLAAMYLDSDMETVRSFLLPKLKEMLNFVVRNGAEDYKSMLQRIVQQTPEEKLTYEETGEEGPPHDRTFHFSVYLNSNLLGQGSGRTKREAEQEAAKKALVLLGELAEDNI